MLGPLSSVGAEFCCQLRRRFRVLQGLSVDRGCDCGRWARGKPRKCWGSRQSRPMVRPLEIALRNRTISRSSCLASFRRRQVLSQKQMKSASIGLLVGGVLVAIASGWFGFHQLPAAVLPLRIIAGGVVWLLAMVVLLLVCWMSKLIKKWNRGTIVLAAATLLSSALIAAGYLLPPDRRGYNFDPDPAGLSPPH